MTSTRNDGLFLENFLPFIHKVSRILLQHIAEYGAMHSSTILNTLQDTLWDDECLFSLYIHEHIWQLFGASLPLYNIQRKGYRQWHIYM